MQNGFGLHKKTWCNSNLSLVQKTVNALTLILMDRYKCQVLRFSNQNEYVGNLYIVFHKNTHCISLPKTRKKFFETREVIDAIIFILLYHKVSLNNVSLVCA